MKDQNRPGMNQKSVQDSGLLGHFSKSDIRHWQRVIFRQSYTRNGRAFLTKDWAMKIAHEGRRETFLLARRTRPRPRHELATFIFLWLVLGGTQLWHGTKGQERLLLIKRSRSPVLSANSLMRCSGQPGASA